MTIVQKHIDFYKDKLAHIVAAENDAENGYEPEDGGKICGHYIGLVHSNFLYIGLGCAIQFLTRLVYFGMCTPNSIMTPCHIFMELNGYLPCVVRVLIMI